MKAYRYFPSLYICCLLIWVTFLEIRYQILLKTLREMNLHVVDRDLDTSSILYLHVLNFLRQVVGMDAGYVILMAKDRIFWDQLHYLLQFQHGL